MNFWLTDPDRNILFKEQSIITPTNIENVSEEYLIQINENEKYQNIDGFGFALTGGSAFHLFNLDNQTRSDILHELFDTENNHLGVSYLRLSIGSSDLDEAVFSFDDLPPGRTDVNMTLFCLNKDRLYLIPIIKEILSINPTIKLLGSPWSPPVWMKDNGNTIGGSLLTQYYDAYALYLLKYIQEMEKEGIQIDAITIQNEPLYGGNNPSMIMTAEEQKNFIKQSLGPLFRQNSIKCKIIIYDHNPDRPDYPLSILNDQEAKQYIDGSAFHMYAGSIETLSMVHDAHPDKNIYFTEQWVGAPGNLKYDFKWHIKTLIIGAIRNWARNVIEWNLAADSKSEPHTPGGCDSCLGALTIDGNSIRSPRNPSYYVIAHASKFVRPNSTRIYSNSPRSLPNVAFTSNQSGKKVLIVLNDDEHRPITFQISNNQKYYQVKLNPFAVGTFIW